MLWESLLIVCPSCALAPVLGPVFFRFRYSLIHNDTRPLFTIVVRRW